MDREGEPTDKSTEFGAMAWNWDTLKRLNEPPSLNKQL
jgi:hypothetical protein